MAIISVIIPCYNVSSYIDRMMQSIENQTFGISNLEVILVDDASTDDTLSKLNTWEQKYPDNIVVVSYDINSRQGKARNIGLGYASAPYIAFLDSDDWIEPCYFEHLYDAMVNTPCDFVCCEMQRDASINLSYFENTAIPNKERRYMIIDSEEKRKMLLFLSSINYAAYCKLFNREFLIKNNLYFPEEIAYEDACWGPLLSFYANKVVFIPEVLYHYFVNESSTILNGNASHHLDQVTAGLLFIEACKNRGFYPIYRDEIELNIIYNCFLAFLKILSLRYKEPSYSHYMLMIGIVRSIIPDYTLNKYVINRNLRELHMSLLPLLSNNINKKEFDSLMKQLATIIL